MSDFYDLSSLRPEVVAAAVPTTLMSPQGTSCLTGLKIHHQNDRFLFQPLHIVPFQADYKTLYQLQSSEDNQ